MAMRSEAVHFIRQSVQDEGKAYPDRVLTLSPPETGIAGMMFPATEYVIDVCATHGQSLSHMRSCITIIVVSAVSSYKVT
jgi:hypothetical protein